MSEKKRKRELEQARERAEAEQGVSGGGHPHVKLVSLGDGSKMVIPNPDFAMMDTSGQVIFHREKGIFQEIDKVERRVQAWVDGLQSLNERFLAMEKQSQEDVRSLRESHVALDGAHKELRHRVLIWDSATGSCFGDVNRRVDDLVRAGMSLREDVRRLTERVLRLEKSVRWEDLADRVYKLERNQEDVAVLKAEQNVLLGEGAAAEKEMKT